MPFNRSFQIPSGNTLTDYFAREIAYALGTGYQAPDGSLLAEDLRVWGQGVADAYGTLTRAINQNFVQISDDLLLEWEFRLGIPLSQGAPVTDRRTALVAKRRAGGGGTAKLVMDAVRAIDPSAVLYTNSASDVASISPRGVFQFAVQVSAATFANTTKLEALRAILEQMKPAYTYFSAAVDVPGRYDVSRYDQSTYG